MILDVSESFGNHAEHLLCDAQPGFGDLERFKGSIQRYVCVSVVRPTLIPRAELASEPRPNADKVCGQCPDALSDLAVFQADTKLITRNDDQLSASIPGEVVN